MNNLVLVCGLPGSGKSTFMEKLERDFLTVLCPDEFRKILTGKNFHGPAEETIWSHVKIATRVFLMRGYHVGLDSTAITPHSRRQWISLAKEIDPNICVGCHVLLTPYSLCFLRNAQRDRIVPDFVMEKKREEFSIPTLDEGFSYIDFHQNDQELGLASVDSTGARWFYGEAWDFRTIGNPYKIDRFL